MSHIIQSNTYTWLQFLYHTKVNNNIQSKIDKVVFQRFINENGDLSGQCRCGYKHGHGHHHCHLYDNEKKLPRDRPSDDDESVTFLRRKYYCGYGNSIRGHRSSCSEYYRRHRERSPESIRYFNVTQ